MLDAWLTEEAETSLEKTAGSQFDEVLQKMEIPELLGLVRGEQPEPEEAEKTAAKKERPEYGSPEETEQMERTVKAIRRGAPVVGGLSLGALEAIQRGVSGTTGLSRKVTVPAMAGVGALAAYGGARGGEAVGRKIREKVIEKREREKAEKEKTSMAKCSGCGAPIKLGMTKCSKCSMHKRASDEAAEIMTAVTAGQALAQKVAMEKEAVSYRSFVRDMPEGEGAVSARRVISKKYQDKPPVVERVRKPGEGKWSGTTSEAARSRIMEEAAAPSRRAQQAVQRAYEGKIEGPVLRGKEQARAAFEKVRTQRKGVSGAKKALMKAKGKVAPLLKRIVKRGQDEASYRDMAVKLASEGRLRTYSAVE